MLPSIRNPTARGPVSLQPLTHPTFLAINCRIPPGLPPVSQAAQGAAARAYRESLWEQLRELLGHTADDPGHWNYSPEWMGSAGGGFGRDDGQVIFSRQSPFNGRVEVTAHEASNSGFATDVPTAAIDSDNVRQEWRVLRFNGVARQSVARVYVSDTGAGVDQQQRRWLQAGQMVTCVPECLAQEYLKTMASVLAAVLALQRLLPGKSGGTLRQADGSSASSGQPGVLRILCIGLGGGSLPLFLAHMLPHADIDAVEIDAAVMEAATTAMGLPRDLPNMRLHVGDGMEYLQQHVTERRATFDVVCLDAFNGEDTVPEKLCGGGFARLLAAALHPTHGTLLANFHSLDVRPFAAIFKQGLWGAAGAESAPMDGGSSDTSSKDFGSEASTRGSRALATPVPEGSCFLVSSKFQANVIMTCSRGLQLPSGLGEAKERLQLAAAYVADEAGFPFPAGSRACRNLMIL